MKEEEKTINNLIEFTLNEELWKDKEFSKKERLQKRFEINLKQFLSEKIGNFLEKFHQNLDKNKIDECPNCKTEFSLDGVVSTSGVHALFDTELKEFKKSLGVEKDG